MLTTEAARTLADRLAKDPAEDLSGGPDELGELLSQGFLTSSAPSISDATLDDVGGRGQMVVTIGGGVAGEPSPASELFMEPFVTELVAIGRRLRRR